MAEPQSHAPEAIAARWDRLAEIEFKSMRDYARLGEQAFVDVRALLDCLTVAREAIDHVQAAHEKQLTDAVKERARLERKVARLKGDSTPPKPRMWSRYQEIPKDVTATDRDGDTVMFKEGHWQTHPAVADHWIAASNFYAPFTERKAE